MTVLTNAILVLPDEILSGTIVMQGETIADIQPGRSYVRNAIDLGGDTVIPGAVDVHTDNLERQVQPRSLARWPSRSAMVAAKYLSNAICPPSLLTMPAPSTATLSPPTESVNLL